MRDREPRVLLGLGSSALDDTLQPALAPAHEADRDRRRDRLRDRARRRARRVSATAALDQPIGLVSDFLYTIPSLALFQLLVPITGLTVTTVEIALVSYTLLILYRNILEGCAACPSDVREAARGMGLTRRQTLLRDRAAARAAGDRRRPPDRDRLDDLDRHHRRVRDPRRARHGRSSSGSGRTSSRRRSSPPACSRSCSRSRPTRPRRRAARAHARGGRVIARRHLQLGARSPDAFRFIGDHPHLLLVKTVRAPGALAARRIGDRARDRAAARASSLGHLRRGSFLAISVSNIGRALPSLVLIAFVLLVFGILLGQHVALVVLAVPADPDERVLRRRRCRPGHRRGGAGDGDARTRHPAGASSCRSRCR